MMKKEQIKLPEDVSAKYEVLNPIRQLIIQKPKKRKIVLESCTMEDAAILAEKGYLKEKAANRAVLKEK